MWEIHTFGNGDVIAGLLSGLTLMMTSTTMMSILVVCGLLMMLFILGNPFGESRKALTAFAGLVVIVVRGSKNSTSTASQVIVITACP